MRVSKIKNVVSSLVGVCFLILLQTGCGSSQSPNSQNGLISNGCGAGLTWNGIGCVPSNVNNGYPTPSPSATPDNHNCPTGWTWNAQITGCVQGTGTTNSCQAGYVNTYYGCTPLVYSYACGYYYQYYTLYGSTCLQIIQ